MIVDLPWMQVASCHPKNRRPEWPTLDFYTDGDEVPLDVAYACAACPVRSACEDHALRHETYGIWAGLTEADRRAMRRRLNMEAPADESSAERKRLRFLRSKRRKRLDPAYVAKEYAAKLSRRESRRLQRRPTTVHHGKAPPIRASELFDLFSTASPDSKETHDQPV